MLGGFTLRNSRRVLCCIALVGFGALLSACSLNPFGTTAAPTAATTPTSTPATSSASATHTPTAAEATAVVKTAFAKSPAPRSWDPLLQSGDWGYHSLTKYETEVSQSSPLTNETIDQVEDAKLQVEQEGQLLKIFRNSSKVHEVIDKAGGDSSDATYTITDVSATAEGGTSVPWVTATLRADFGTNDGVKALEVWVYRQRNKKGMDMRPWVSGAIVGYVDANGSIVNPVPVRF